MVSLNLVTLCLCLLSASAQEVADGSNESTLEKISFIPGVGPAGFLAIVGGFILIMIIIAVVIIRRRMHHSASSSDSAEKGDLGMAVGGTHLVVNGRTVPLIPANAIIGGTHILGTGNFATVKSGTFQNRHKVKTPIAIKTLRPEDGFDDETTLAGMLEEAAIMSNLNHPNIITLYGVLNTADSHAIVMELAEGTLKNWLDRQRSVGKHPSEVGIKRLAKFCQQIASAMDYMGKQNIIHRDLSARNILLTKSLTVKISDMGLSRELFDKAYYRLKTARPLPIRWMPPETLNYRLTSSASDVWSFGVTMWEVFSLGENPYEGLGNQEMPEFLAQGKRLSKPDQCPTSIFDVMRLCWMQKPEDRPSFAMVTNTLKDIVELNVELEANLGGKPVKWDFFTHNTSMAGRIACVLRVGQTPHAELHRCLLRQPLDPVPVSLIGFTEECPDHQKQSFLREAALLRRVDHKNVQKFFGHLQTKDKSHLVIEFPDSGNLKTLLEEEPLLLEEQLPILRQVCAGMEQLGIAGICHNFLQPVNVALSNGRTVKITGFGRACVLNKRQIEEPEMPIERFSALECRTDALFSKESDVWAFGCMLWEVLEHGREIFHGKNDDQIDEMLSNGRFPPKPAESPAVLYEVMRKCWNTEPSARPTFSQLIEILDSAEGMNNALGNLEDIVEFDLDAAADDGSEHDTTSLPSDYVPLPSDSTDISGNSLYPVAV